MAQLPIYASSQSFLSSDRPFEDEDGRIFLMLAGQPDDPTYAADAAALFTVMREESASGNFTAKELSHKRGRFPAINAGFTMPNGFREPINLGNSHHQETVDRIRAHSGFKRISAYHNGSARFPIYQPVYSISHLVSASFALWNPGLYAYYRERVQKLCEKMPHLQKNTPKTIFPTAAFNLCNVCTFKHRDTQNCPFGWCAITALGSFDAKKGGHIVFSDLKLIVEFPPGSTILIPSATIEHYNIPVAEGEERASLTQYCAGNIL